MTPQPNNSFDREHWQKVLEKIALALGKEGDPVELCLIGSAACILGGMIGRTSMDLNVWKPASDYERLELQAAVEQAGQLFNPLTELEPDCSYIQIVELGIVQVGTFQPVLIEKIGRLRITRPPIENIIAAKLPRCSEKDLEDIAYLKKKYDVPIDLVKAIIGEFHGHAAESARENLIYLEVLQ